MRTLQARYACSRRAVLRRLAVARSSGLSEDAKTHIVETLVPKALHVFNQALEARDVSVATDVLFGTGALLKNPQPLSTTTETTDEIDTIEACRAQRERRVRQEDASQASPVPPEASPTAPRSGPRGAASTQGSTMKPITCGVWTFEPNSLVIQPRTDDYWIDLQTRRDSAEILDWIAQLRAKNWVSSRDPGDLVTLMDDLQGFQSNFCGCGRSSAANPAAILEARFGRGFRKKSPAPSPNPPTA